jgi:hypothetical protein
MIRGSLLFAADYEVIAETDSASELARLVSEETPELVIGSLPLVLGAEAEEQPFPLCIAIGRTPVTSPARTIASLPEQVLAPAVEEALATAVVSILNVKASELSHLIRQYVLHSDTVVPQPLTLEVERDGRRTEIEVDAVQWINAAGNYVRLHTADGACVMRASIRSVATRLLRAGFVRIHRGTVVNTRSVRSHVVHDDGVAAVVLQDGTHLAVGPRYRELVLRDSVSAPQ